MKILKSVLILILTICSSVLYSAEGVISNEEFKKFVADIQYPSQMKYPPVGYYTGPFEPKNLGIPQFDTAALALKRLAEESYWHVKKFELPPEILLNKMELCTKLMLKHVDQEITEAECLKPGQFSKYFTIMDHLTEKILRPYPREGGFKISGEQAASFMPFLRRVIEKFKFEIASKKYSGQKIRALFLKKQLRKARSLLIKLNETANNWQQKLVTSTHDAKKWSFYQKAWPDYYFNKF